MKHAGVISDQTNAHNGKKLEEDRGHTGILLRMSSSFARKGQ